MAFQSCLKDNPESIRDSARDFSAEFRARWGGVRADVLTKIWEGVKHYPYPDLIHVLKGLSDGTYTRYSFGGWATIGDIVNAVSILEAGRARMRELNANIKCPYCGGAKTLPAVQNRKGEILDLTLGCSQDFPLYEVYVDCICQRPNSETSKLAVKCLKIWTLQYITECYKRRNSNG